MIWEIQTQNSSWLQCLSCCELGYVELFSACKQKKDKKSFLINTCILNVGFAKSEIYSKLLKLVICSNPHSKCSISRRDTCSGLNKHRFYKAVNSQIFI